VTDQFSWHRSTDFETVAEEVRAVREQVGLIETSGFAKYSVTGRGAAAWLDRLLGCRMPAAGRMTLAPMLKEDGRLIGDFTLANLGAEGYLLIGSGVAEDYHLRWFEQHLPEDGSVQLASKGSALVGLAIAGPRSRELLASVTRQDLSTAAFKFMDVRRMDVGMASVIAGRVSYTGDIGYELWCDPANQVHLFDTLMSAGAPFGLKLFGSRALNALRLEKGYGSWAREYRPLYSAVEAGLDRFVAVGKDAPFIGKESAAAERASGGKLRLRVFVVDADDADPIGDEPIWRGGEVCGWVTSGGYAHGSKVSVAVGYVPKAVADERDGWSIQILGRHYPARLQSRPLFDPDGKRMMA
jgi:dimethylglycine dehydrogenase